MNNKNFTKRGFQGPSSNFFIIIIIIIKKGWQGKAGRDRLTPNQNEDPNPTTPTHRMKEEKVKTAGDKSERAARPIKRHWPCS